MPTHGGPAAPFPEGDEPVLVVEVHLPIDADGGSADSIDRIEEFLSRHADQWFDDGEEVGDDFVWPLSNGSRAELLELAADIAALPGLPDGLFAVVTDSDDLFSDDGDAIPLL
ncbi:hypothetical protein ACPEEZ_12705 [Frigoribacterium sp. 2-23]|uniref:hypothetical protein n=1 Tax=Frigoribacterium sp. 2-23 TaxID=3415006 RepID=UPI003C70326C